MKNLISSYVEKLAQQLHTIEQTDIEELAKSLLDAVEHDKRVFICGNGGSAGNAVHLANDFLYGIEPGGRALDIEALSANQAVLTCLGNDIGYDKIYSHQLKVKARAGDVLIALSGSGNSPNILEALKEANRIGMVSFAVLGFRGGEAKSLASHVLHFEVDDMQISEDLQMVVGHMLMQHLCTELSAKKINSGDRDLS